ncbi:hypothetical protein ACHAXT_008683 [Thalassiosira profunda]
MPSSSSDGGSNSGPSSPSSSPSPASQKERPKSGGGASSSVDWDPDSGDSSSDRPRRRADSMPSAESTTASKSRKRKRSDSDASGGWNPDESYGDRSSSQDGHSNEEAQFPSSIDIKIPAEAPSAIKVALPPESIKEEAPESEDINANLFGAFSDERTKPPERIRYEMLGAPTLLYRHAPSYLDPTNRPSVLTPHQLSMALYMNEHPMRDWFADQKSLGTRRRSTARPKKSALLTSEYVPQPPQPWGRPREWDRRTGTRSGGTSRREESEDARNGRRQAELDVHNFVENAHQSNRAGVLPLREEIEQRNGVASSEERSDASGFNVFCAEYIEQLDESERDSATADGPRHHFELARKAWDDLSEAEQSRYNPETRAQARRSRRGMTTGFNVLVSECAQTYDLPDDATNADTKLQFAYAVHLAGSLWKDMAEEEKSDYRERADEINARREEGGEQFNEAPQKLGTVHHLKGKTSAFKLMVSDYTRRWKESNPNPSAADRQIAMIKCTKEASADWKNLSAEEREVYRERAKEENERRANEASEDNQAPPPHPKKSLKGKTTGFNVYYSEMYERLKQNNPIDDGASKRKKKNHLKLLRAKVFADWKTMSESRKSRYKLEAEKHNEEVEQQQQHDAPSDDGGREDAQSVASLASDGSGRLQRRWWSTTGFNIWYSEAVAKRKKPVKYFRRKMGAVWKSMPMNEKAPYNREAKRLTEEAKSKVLNVQSDLNEKKALRDEQGIKRGDNEQIGSEKKVARERRKHPLVGKRHEDEPDPPLGAARNILRGRESCLPAANEHTLTCVDYFAPFRRQDVGLGFHLGFKTRSGLADGRRLPKNQNSDGSDDGQSERSKYLANDTLDEEASSGEETKIDALRGDDSHFLSDEVDEPNAQDLSQDRHGVGGPSGHGNCLVAIPCKCRNCERHSSSWFLVHPTGDDLSSVAISKLFLPLGTSFDAADDSPMVDVGRRILQISLCGAASTPSDMTEQPLCLVARTAQYCSVIVVEATPKYSPVPGKCCVDLSMTEATRIDLHAPQMMSAEPSYLPVHVTCDVKLSSFVSPSIAILSRDYSGDCTTVHRVQLRDEPRAKTYSLSASLADISLIEIDPRDRMALWAAARSRHMPELSHGFFKARGGIVTGYGHSLFRIDLRTNSCSRVWSPSHAEYLTEGLHHISGIVPDTTRDHILWVSSCSAGKIWALDTRYKAAKVLVRWSLSHLCDDYGPQMPITGVYGAGVLMNNSPCHTEQPPLVFSMRKAPNAYSVSVSQFPSAMPRFQTLPLESAGFQEMPQQKVETSSIARSAIFPLPDVSSSLFNIGLATIQSSVKSAVTERQLGRLGYETPPANVTFVLTMTSLGDVYCHSLLETNAMEESRAKQFPGLPVGTKAIPVYYAGKKKKAPKPVPGQWSITLGNEFPVPSSAVTPYAIRNPNECCSSRSFNIGNILQQQADGEGESESSRTAHDGGIKEEYSGEMDTFRVASKRAQQNEEGLTSSFVDLPKTPAVFHHSLAKHGVASGGGQPPQIHLPSRHMEVAMNRNDDAAGVHSEEIFEMGQNEEMGSGLLSKLKGSFFDTAGDGSTPVKREWNSDSE